MILRTRSPYTRLDAVDRVFDELTHAFFAPSPRTPVVDARWHDGALELSVDLPGTPEDAIDVSVAGRTLTISVQRDAFEWTRSLHLGAALDPESVSAAYVHGRLTVTVAPVPAATPRRIAITRPEAAALEAADVEAAASEEPTQGAGTDTTDNG